MTPETLAGIAANWPQILGALLLLAGLVILIVWLGVRESRPASVVVGAESKEPPPAEKPRSRWAGWMSRPKESAGLRQSFSTATKFLRASVAGRDYRYDIPWFVLVGGKGSGKTTLLESVGSGVNYGEHGPPGEGVEWRFFDQGIVLGIETRLFADDLSPDGGASGWRQVLRQLEKHRPRRPADGIVLTIPATTLAGPEKLDEARLSAAAAVAGDRLSEAQRALGISFPVYLIVTRLDEVAGFRSFFRELPSARRDSMFGWSSPYQIESAFAPTWVDEAFNAVSEDLQRLQSEIFVERGQVANPDEVFLFPEEFNGLREPLRQYLARLFRDTVYREPFRFRGVYFTGDLEGSAGSVSPAAAPPPPTPEDEEDAYFLSTYRPAPAVAPEPAAPARRSEPQRTPVFLADLFERKIFPESGIARPLGAVFFSRNRTVIVIQVCSVLLAAGLAWGTWSAYRRLEEERDRAVIPMLTQVLALPEAKEENRHLILDFMEEAGSANFRSPMLPTSLLSSSDAKIADVMTSALDRYVMTNLATGLRKQTIRTLRVPAEAPADPVANADRPLTIEGNPAYLRLFRFVNDLRALDRNARTYEQLRQPGATGNVEHIRDLVQFLYGSSLGEFSLNGHFARALDRAVGPPFQVNVQDREQSTEIARVSIASLFGEWYDSNVLLTDAARLRQLIAKIDQQRGIRVDDLGELQGAFKQLESHLNTPGLRAATAPKFELPVSLRALVVDAIEKENNPFLGRELLGYLGQLGEGKALQLRAALAAESTPLTGPLLEVGDTVTLSSSAGVFKLGLENLINLRFMSSGQGRAIRTTIPAGTRLLWRREPLVEALRLYDVYTRFTEEGLSDATPRLRSSFSRVALDRLSANLQDLVYQAQDLQPRRVVQEANADDLQLEIQAFRDSSDAINQLAGRFRDAGLIDSQNRLIAIVRLQAQQTLRALDERLAGEDPYASRDRSFGWWDGSAPVSLPAFEVRNPGELVEYLAAQRDRIKLLAQQAEPFVRFLDAWVPQRTEAEARAASRWQTILSDFRQYDGKRPGASLALLEKFVVEDMDKVRPEGGCASGETTESRESRADYFVQIRNELRKGLAERCEILAADAVYRAYANIAGLFNRTLAGLFPFAPVSAERTQLEAAPEALAEFYRVFDRDAKAARATLQGNRRLSGSSAGALEFLDRMEQLRPLVVSGAPDAEKEPPLSLDFTPRFRVNREAEQGANQIIEWTLQVGGQIFRLGEPDHPGRWRPGGPVRLYLRWAKDSLSLPLADPRQPDLRLRDRAVFFEETGRWSLLAFLKRHEAPASEVVRPGETKPYVLKFRVRTGPDPRWAQPQGGDPAEAAVFLQIGVAPPGGKNAILLPTFPTVAPTLDRPAR